MGAVVSTKEFADLRKKVCEHEDWIDGNGKPGAKTRLALLENQFEKIEGKLNWILGLMGSIFTAVIIYLLTRGG